VMTGILPDDRTTDKRPALFLESRPYDIGYNDLEGCRYRRLVMLVRLRLNSYLPPFKEGKRSGQSFVYSVVKVLKKYVFSFIIKQLVIRLNFKN